MDKIQLNELAIAYAQARLTRKQFDSKNPPNEDELYNFAHDYLFAMEKLEKQFKQYPTIPKS